MSDSQNMFEEITEYLKGIHLLFWNKVGRDSIPVGGLMHWKTAETHFAQFIRYEIVSVNPDNGLICYGSQYVDFEGVHIHLSDHVLTEDGVYFWDQPLLEIRRMEPPKIELTTPWWSPRLRLGTSHYKNSMWTDPTID